MMEKAEKMRVLVADDDRGLRDGICAQVAAEGFEPVPCSNGAAALNLMRSPDAPHLALLDWSMPDITGLDVCRQLRDGASGVRPYLILLTIKDRISEIVEGLDAGADAYITKPFSLVELRARLRVGARQVEHELSLWNRMQVTEQA